MKPILYFFVALSVLFPGCNYLDMVPEKDIETLETIFEKREEAERWMKSCYTFLVDPVGSVIQCPAFTGADEVVGGDYIRRDSRYLPWQGFYIGDGLQMAQDPYGDIWRGDGFYAAIRYCNVFLQKIGQVYNMEDKEKELWIAEIKALKAHYYFELMRRYGPIILVPENIGVDEDVAAMQQPRCPIDSCVNATLRLLDEAMEVLPLWSQQNQSCQGYHSLESAAALKAQVLLYAASPLFNGNPSYTNFVNKEGVRLFPDYDREKWRLAAEATDEAIRISLEGGKKLIKGNTTKPTKLLNTMADIEASVQAYNYTNDEVIFSVKQMSTFRNTWWYMWTLPYLNDGNVDFSEDVQGCISPSLKMVEMYYTENGLPIYADPTWEYALRYTASTEYRQDYRSVVALNTDVLRLHLRREPRFYAHIAADRCYWQRGKNANQNLLVKPYRGEEFGSRYSTIDQNEKQNLTGYWMKKGLYSDVPTKEYISSVGAREEPIILMRLADLYLMAAEAWNEYLDAPDNRVYDPLDEVRKRAGIPGVVDAWSVSNNPGKVRTKTGMREIIHDEWNVEFAFEGRRFWNLRRWLTAAEELNTKLYGWNVLGETAQQFYNDYKEPLVVWSKRKFVAPRDYLFPIRSEEVMVSGCVQNPGW